jgi:hypothetical protein
MLGLAPGIVVSADGSPRRLRGAAGGRELEHVEVALAHRYALYQSFFDQVFGSTRCTADMCKPPADR